MGLCIQVPLNPCPCHVPPNRKPFFGPTLIGACTGMILCIPLAAYTAAALGDDYNTRALIYCGFLLWVHRRAPSCSS